MYALDDALAAALDAGAPTLLVRLVALEQDGDVRRTFDLAQQVIVSGSASAELRRDARRTASLEVRATPELTSDMLAQGAAVRVESGALVTSGPMFVPLVTGFVTAAGATMRSGTVSLTVESYLSACRQEAGEALVLAQGAALVDALHTLWDPVLPFVEWLADDAARERTLGSTVPVLPGDSRLDVGLRLARSVGCEAFDDRMGRLVVRARPDPTTQPTARLMSEPIDLFRGFSRPPVNAQPVEASPGDGEPFYVVEEVTDPGSPLHRDRIGLRMADIIRSDTIPDPDTARALARAWLQGRMLRADTVTATERPRHLDLDEGDVVAREEPVTGTSGRYVIEQITYPLGPGTITTSETAVLPLFLDEDAA